MEADSASWYRKLDNLIFSLVKIYKIDFEKADRMPDNIKLTDNELAVMQILEWKPEATVSMIAGYLGIPLSKLTSVINRMEKKDILVRKKFPDDNRVIKLEFTEAGEKIFLKRKEAKKSIYKYIFHALENDIERKTLIKLLEKISGSTAGANEKTNFTLKE